MKSKLFTFTGIFCLVLALIISVNNLIDDRISINSQNKLIEAYDNQIVDESLLEVPDYVLNPDMDMPEVDVDGLSCIGILEVSSLDLRLPILGDWSDELLKKAPCRYSGSVYTNNMVIAGHNSRAQFNKLNKLKEGDLIVFTDVVGNVFEYHVSAIEVLDGDDVDGMLNGWPLTLFMCTYDNLSRYTIRRE